MLASYRNLASTWLTYCLACRRRGMTHLDKLPKSFGPDRSVNLSIRMTIPWQGLMMTKMIIPRTINSFYLGLRRHNCHSEFEVTFSCWKGYKSSFPSFSRIFLGHPWHPSLPVLSGAGSCGFMAVYRTILRYYFNLILPALILFDQCHAQLRWDTTFSS